MKYLEAAMDLFIWGALFGATAGVLIVSIAIISKRSDHE